MEKKKLGINVGLLGSGMFGLLLCGGYVPALLLFLYIIFYEENEWIRRTGAEAIIVMTVFSFAEILIGFVPNVLGAIGDLTEIFGASFNPVRLLALFNIITNVLNIAKIILFVKLMLDCLKQKELRIPVIGKLIDKYMPYTNFAFD